jgi:hypothetical protein
MVRLEWAHIEAFDGPAAKPLGPEDLLDLGPGLRMSLPPYMTLLDVHYAVDDLRISVSQGNDPHGTASNAATATKHRATKRKSVPRQKAPIFIAVHRFDDSVYYRRVEPEAFRILTALRGGATIGTAIEKGFEGSSLSADDYQGNIGKWFAIWSELGWLCRPDVQIAKRTRA